MDSIAGGKWLCRQVLGKFCHLNILFLCQGFGVVSHCAAGPFHPPRRDRQPAATEYRTPPTPAPVHARPRQPGTRNPSQPGPPHACPVLHGLNPFHIIIPCSFLATFNMSLTISTRSFCIIIIYSWNLYRGLVASFVGGSILQYISFKFYYNSANCEIIMSHVLYRQ